MSQVIRLADERRRRGRIAFTRLELNRLLSLYSRRVITGEWRDYAIDMSRGVAAFSIYRHSAEGPLYSIVKFPSGSFRNGDYIVFSGPRKLSQGVTIEETLRVFDRKLRVVS